VQFSHHVFAVVNPPNGCSIRFAFKIVNFNTFIPPEDGIPLFPADYRGKGKGALPEIPTIPFRLIA
jgi:hypothetical protein